MNRTVWWYGIGAIAATFAIVAMRSICAHRSETSGRVEDEAMSLGPNAPASPPTPDRDSVEPTSNVLVRRDLAGRLEQGEHTSQQQASLFSLRGEVRDACNQPVSGSIIQILQGNPSQHIATTTSEDDGSFWFANIPCDDSAGELVVRAVDSGCGVAKVEQVLDVRGARNDPWVLLQFRGFGVVMGGIRDTLRAAPIRARLALQPLGSEDNWQTQTAEDGTFCIHVVPVGTTLVEAWRVEAVEGTLTGEYLAGRRVIEVESDTATSVWFEDDWSERVQLRGRVMRESQGMLYPRLEFWQGGAQTARLVARAFGNHKGDVECFMAIGAYDVLLRANGDRRWLGKIHVDGGSADGFTLALGSGVVRGRAFDDLGNEIDASKLQILRVDLPADVVELGGRAVDLLPCHDTEDGGFEARYLSNGVWSVLCTQDGVRIMSAPIQVTGGDATVEVRAVLRE